jgi:hypothetical protein
MQNCKAKRYSCNSATDSLMKTPNYNSIKGITLTMSTQTLLFKCNFMK